MLILIWSKLIANNQKNQRLKLIKSNYKFNSYSALIGDGASMLLQQLYTRIWVFRFVRFIFHFFESVKEVKLLESLITLQCLSLHKIDLFAKFEKEIWFFFLNFYYINRSEEFISNETNIFISINESMIEWIGIIDVENDENSKRKSRFSDGTLHWVNLFCILYFDFKSPLWNRKKIQTKKSNKNLTKNQKKNKFCVFILLEGVPTTPLNRL